MSLDPRATDGSGHDPSAPGARLPVVILSLAGVILAGYLTLFQIGVVADVWEPFFGDGSRIVLTSGISRLLPVPDASLGAAAYLLELVIGAVGGRERWRTTPWAVLLLGLVAGALALASILLTGAQPLLYHAWCTLCLTSAAISFLMVLAVSDEVLASVRHLARVGRAGGSWWRALWGSGAGIGRGAA